MRWNRSARSRCALDGDVEDLSMLSLTGGNLRDQLIVNVEFLIPLVCGSVQLVCGVCGQSQFMYISREGVQ